MEKIISILTFLAVTSGCQRIYNQAPPISSKKAAQVFAANCITCHNEYSYYKDQDFAKVGLINPGVADTSLIYVTLNGAGSDAVGTMPPKSTLSKEDIKSVREWINSISYQKNPLTLTNYKIEGEATQLSETQLFKRCYSQMTRSPLDPNNSIFKDVLENKISGEAGCKRLIEQTSLAQGKTLSDTNKKILKTFQAFHRSWFKELNLYNNDEQWGNFEVYDPGNLAASITYNLLSANSKIDDLFLGDTTHELVRQPKNDRTFFIFPFQESGPNPLKLNDFKFGTGTEISEDRYPKWNITPIAHGEIVGVRPTPKNRDVIPDVVNCRKPVRKVFGQIESHVNQDIRKGLGGGILGNPLHLLLNLKLETGEHMDGGKVVPRKWSSTLINEFLCRELPVVPIHKIEKYVVPNSSISFRKKKSCVQCHATIDSLPGILRNYEINYSVDSGLGKYLQTTHLKYNPPTLKTSSPILGEGKKDYYLEPPVGRFVYQSTDGAFYDKEISNLQELADLLLKNPDLYKCFSKKYFYFFTGIDVDIEMRAPQSNYNKVALYTVEELARRFQVHKNLKQLIFDIFETPFYRDQHYLQNAPITPSKNSRNTASF